jgi:hypothetical protein
MHHLVAVQAEDGRAQDSLAVGIDQYLHEPLRFAGFARAADTLHRHLGAQHTFATGLRLDLRHADAPERRVDEQRIAGDAVT